MTADHQSNAVATINGLESAPQYPAKLLLGVKLDDGWEVVEKISKEKADLSDLTPGFFSVGYRVKKGDSYAFLKAFDLEAAISVANRRPDDPMQMMQAVQELSSAFTSESTLLDFCTQSNLDKIVKVIKKGFASPPAGVAVAASFPVPYLMFELAEEGDIRGLIQKTEVADDYLRLTHLHSVSVGLQQLHTNQICHQDLKPANVLIFRNGGAKIGDLGRASRKESPASHDSFAIPGDMRYAPPELSYREVPTSWVDRRESSDLYHLGSLMAYLFTGVSINVLLYENLPKEFHHREWRGRYDDVLPHLEAAFAEVVSSVADMFPDWAKTELTEMLKQMCAPAYKKRGAPDARSQQNNPLGLDRFVSKFDLLSKQAKIQIKKAL